MELNRAKEILKIRQEEKDKVSEAETLVDEELKKQQLAVIEAEKDRKKKEIKEFVARIPKSLCKPYTKCTGCKTENEFDNKALIETVDGTFRIMTCKQCGNFIIDYIDFKASEGDTTALEPYAYKLRSGEKW